MPLLQLKAVSYQLGERLLLDGVDLSLKRGDRVGLLGRNGEGKTTLLRIVAGELAADGGERWLRPGCVVASLSQMLPGESGQTVYDVVAAGLAEAGELLRRYHGCVQAGDSADLRELEAIQHQLEAAGGWHLQQRVETVLSQLELPADARLGELSGGWRRRVALAQALVREPDVLLLDEPTNHLDIPTIEWLQEMLASFRGAILFVTHDRAFLRRLATRIAELDRGHLHQWDGDYRGFLLFREQQLAAEESANAEFDKRLAAEERWIRQGIKARRTRNEGRVRALKAMRAEYRDRRERLGKARIDLDSAERSGRMVSRAIDASVAYEGKTVICNLSTEIQRGGRIGIVGANGAGKSTLLKLLLGEIAPSSGRVELGTRLEIAYFDQLGAGLDENLDLIDNVCGGREFIEIGGRRRHAIGYLGDFLFSPGRVRTKVSMLSGGERNRALLAKLFSQPANVLVLDEPTNDLDLETLELLEEVLLEFDGTVLLVSHDREFMDNVVTSIYVLPGDGTVEEHVGGYSDWVRHGGGLAPHGADRESRPVRLAQPAAQPSPQRRARRKLSYKDQRELEALPGEIESLEARLAELTDIMGGEGFYAGDRTAVDEVLGEVETLQTRLEEAYERWQELESMQEEA